MIGPQGGGLFVEIFWCDIRPCLIQPGPFVHWCRSRRLPLEDFLCLEDAIRHFSGVQLQHAVLGRGSTGQSISLSHSGGLVICAQGDGVVGVDTEELRPELPPPVSYFHREELCWAQDQPSRALFQLWTRKECLLKAWGLTLADLSELPSLVEGNHLRSHVGPLFFQEVPILPQHYVTSLLSRRAGPPLLTALTPGQIFPAE